jgi:hypothetical protein
MGEANPTEELRVARHTLFYAWHADQDEANIVTVEEVTQIVQGDRVEAFRFVEDDQLHVLPGQSARRLARMLINTDVDAAEQLVDLVPKRAEISSDVRCIEEDA